MLHLAGEDDTIVHSPPLVETAGLNYGLLTFEPAFQNAIRESLLTGSAVEVRPAGMPLPENEGQLPRFCEGALAACPLRIEVLLFDGRSVQIYLQWLVAETTVVRVLAKDITGQKPEQAELLKTARQPWTALTGQWRESTAPQWTGRLLAANRSSRGCWVSRTSTMPCPPLPM